MGTFASQENCFFAPKQHTQFNKWIKTFQRSTLSSKVLKRYSNEEVILGFNSTDANIKHGQFELLYLLFLILHGYVAQNMSNCPHKPKIHCTEQILLNEGHFMYYCWSCSICVYPIRLGKKLILGDFNFCIKILNYRSRLVGKRALRALQ